ncbi:MAG: 6-carboxytetrahydropterin synthase QueD [Leptolyngbyaceae cyanobacterium RU_5_1]|nr:6-carboxytetrahydropterin synthase QueD [Leptolyngbyaceae cyanobacterium RU_5_1]
MEEWLIYKEFRFEAAHHLPHHTGKCGRLHGHSWVGRVYIQGNKLIEDGSQQGMLLDYGEIKQYIEPLLERYLDHHYLNQTTGLLNPTSEAIARWVFERLEETDLPGLHAVEIRETCTTGARYMKR